MRDLVHNNNRWHVGQTVRHQIVGSHQPIHGYMTASVFNVLLFAGSIHATPWHVYTTAPYIIIVQSQVADGPKVVHTIAQDCQRHSARRGNHHEMPLRVI